ncbi:FAD binding domain-containing protein [Intrasporangium sp. DVR]|uniref:xanthine dehydrogenase small subunit n=1 Tax=Intrasporangium sp. DVR TaxID=3127867 RepID=UPI003341E4C1
MAAPAAIVNGQPLPLDGVAPHTSALDWLREHGLTGAKEGCAEGECGACAVLVARPVIGPFTDDGPAAGASSVQTQWTAMTACLVAAVSLDGQEIVTSEGLGAPDALHPVQHEMAVRGGSQCGYCTPGFVCSMAAEYYRADRPTHRDPDGHVVGPNGFDLEALSGNLCRCTGYRPIRDAAFAVGTPPREDPLAVRRHLRAPAPRATRITGPRGTYARAVDLAEALDLLAVHPDAVVVSGATDWGVEVNLRSARPSVVIGIDRVPELRAWRVAEDRTELGAGLTFSEIETALGGRVPLLAALIPQFASRLIRNSATIGGNLATASPIGDAAPVLLALEARVVLASRGAEREVALADYFTGYRETVRRRDELIRSVRIPMPLSPVTGFHKIAKRRFDDISSVAVAVALDVSDGVVSRARIGLGGVAATPVRARATEAALEGRPWNRDTVAEAARVLSSEGTPMDDHRASAAYRRAMLGTALLRLHADAATPGRPTGRRVEA